MVKLLLLASEEAARAITIKKRAKYFIFVMSFEEKERRF